MRELLDNRITTLKTQKSNDNSFLPKNNSYLKNSLEKTHEQFVVAPIDKANGIVAFICKRFYTEVLMKEVGIDLDDVLNKSGTSYYWINIY